MRIAAAWEFLAALTGGLAALVIATGSVNHQTEIPVVFFLCGMIGWIAWKDIVSYEIPDGPMVAIAVVGAAMRVNDPWNGSLHEGVMIAFDAVFCGGAMLFVRESYYRLRSVDGLGFGDVKLAAACAIWIGTNDLAGAIFAASVTGLVIVFLVNRMTNSTKIERLPFGALLAPACLGMWLLSL